MTESSIFNSDHSHNGIIEPMPAQGGTCDAYRVKLYGKLHFLKRLKSQYTSDIRYREALRKEFETGYRLEHPQLPRYLSFDGDSILMEYIDGETLNERLSHDPDYFSVKNNVDKLLTQLLGVMSYLHSQQVLHLDLKPDNIILTRIGDDLKLVDLGCCLTDTFTDTTGRTDRYAAPEQLQGDSLDVRTDIYAIGKILNELPCHSSIYNKVIERCTAPDKEERYSSVDEIQQELLRYGKRRRNRTATICALLVASVISFFVWVSISHEEDSVYAPEQVAIIDTTTTIPTPPMPEESKDTVSSPLQPQAAPAAVPASSKKVKHTSQPANTTEQLREDIRQTILPLFNATLGCLPDSAVLDSRAWAEACWKLEPQLTPALQQLILDHQDIPMEVVAKEFNDYMESLILLKRNSAKAGK